MKNLNCRTIQTARFLILVLGAVMPASAHAALFMGLGDLPGGPFSSMVLDISSDGTVVVGASAVDAYEWRPGDERPLMEAFRWTREDGMQGLGTLPDRAQSSASGVSSDGAVIVGQSNNPGTQPSGTQFSGAPTAAFRWTEQEGMAAIGSLESPPCSDFGNWATGVSDDGATIVGANFDPLIPEFGCGTQAIRSTEGGSIMGLGFGDDERPDLNESNAVAASADGSVVAGYSLNVNRPFSGMAWLWHEETGTLTDLGFTSSGDDVVRVTDMTPDAKYVLGFGRKPLEPFLWTEESSAVPLSVPSQPTSISDDGSVIVGGDWIWTEPTGTRDLADVLAQDFGLAEQLAGWQLGRTGNSLSAVSGDGRTIAGNGTNPDGESEAWIATLEPAFSLLGDFNLNGELDAGDMDLLSARVRDGTNDLGFDVNDDGLVSQEDRNAWVEDVFGTFFGDADLDNEVSFADFLSLSDNFSAGGGWAEGDFNGDGVVAFPDFLLVSSNFGKSTMAAGAVPEPTAASLFGLGLLGFMRASRRRHRSWHGAALCLPPQRGEPTHKFV